MVFVRCQVCISPVVFRDPLGRLEFFKALCTIHALSKITLFVVVHMTQLFPFIFVVGSDTTKFQAILICLQTQVPFGNFALFVVFSN